jgi:hypothetical protein
MAFGSRVGSLCFYLQFVERVAMTAEKLKTELEKLISEATQLRNVVPRSNETLRAIVTVESRIDRARNGLGYSARQA